MSIVVDSAASRPVDDGKRPPVLVVPMALNISGKTYLDGLDLTTAEFYRMLRESPGAASTSAPTPGSFRDTFVRAAANAEAILCLTVASRFSASYDAARLGADEARQESPETQLHVLDSKSAAGGEGLVALEALRVVEAGGGLEDAIAAAKRVMSKVRLIALVDTLRYLWKSGRVPAIAHAGTSLLQIKPIFELAGGEVRTLARPRTRRRAIRRVADLVAERAEKDKVHATVMHADAAADAADLAQCLGDELDCDELFVSEFTPVMGAHTGPGLLGVAFWSDAS